ncbi:hypothetical protein AX14_000925 [Amanita brunnescens Koide BX004]|nr:hypothetical protein AX14_000925 [Amanita brunnescens Koide BX004]
MALLQPWRYARCIPHLQRSLKVVNKVRANVQPKKRLGSTLHAPCEDVPDFGDYSVVLPPEPFVFGVSHIKPRPVPPHITKPPYAGISRVAENEPDSYEGDGGLRSGKRERIALGGESEFRIREAAKLAKKVRMYAGSLVQVGVMTDTIDEAVHEFIIAHGAYPSPLHYSGFPRSCCTSVNNIMVHGIPDDRPLEDGDIINIDITVYLNGYHGDTSETFLVGDVDAKGRSLVAATTLALQAGISACGPGQPFKHIGKAIHGAIHEPDIAMTDEDIPFSISPQFNGHGIGTDFHKPPWILHDVNDEPGVMVPGDCFTIEPCIVQGTNPIGWMFPDGWTTSTENCARSAQAEHMVLITESGADVLTE